MGAPCPRCGGEPTLAGRQLVTDSRRKAHHTNGRRLVQKPCGHGCHWPGPTPEPEPVDSAPARSGYVVGPDGERIPRKP